MIDAHDVKQYLDQDQAAVMWSFIAVTKNTQLSKLEYSLKEEIKSIVIPTIFPNTFHSQMTSGADLIPHPNPSLLKLFLSSEQDAFIISATLFVGPKVANVLV